MRGMEDFQAVFFMDGDFLGVAAAYTWHRRNIFQRLDILLLK